MKTRKAAFAGMFYPGIKEELESTISTFFNNIPASELGPKAIIVPHAGYPYSGQVAAYAHELLRNCKKKRIIILGPSHSAYFNGVAADVNDFWETPLGVVKVAENNFPKLEEAHSDEHSIEVQIPFLQQTMKDFEILPLAAGNIDPREISKLILPLLEDSFLIISSDLSHFHDYDAAVKLDTNSCKAIQALDYDKFEKEGEACGKIPILAAIEIAKTLKWQCEMLNYANSGEVTNDKDRVVGYASFAFH